MANKKKIILFIVEGINDKTSLALCMNQFLDKNTILFEITDGDITTQYGNSSGNIAAKIGNIIKEFSGKIFKQKDFLEIVHLVDMDGAYVPDDNVIDGIKDKNQYTEKNIETTKIKMTIDRNHQKQEIINKMVGLSKVWVSIPYSVYYFSCNMDHVLHGKANLRREEKDKLATEFENRFFNKPQEFVDFFDSDEFAIKGTYEETWKFIKAGTNSLKRSSNFIIYLTNKKNEE